MSEVLSFAEESCFSGEQLRSIRREIVFQVKCFGRGFPERLSFEFVADYGIWYDYDDTLLLDLLQAQHPQIEWGYFVYHKKMDHSAIEIIEPDRDSVVGYVEVRKRTTKKLPGEETPANVMPWTEVQQWRQDRDDRRAEHARKDKSDGD